MYNKFWSQNSSIILGFSFLLFGLRMPCFAQASSALQRYELIGAVQSVDKVKKRATIKHEPVKNYMDGMTMPFLIKDEKALEEIEAGDQIRATLVVTDDGATWLEHVRIIAKVRRAVSDIAPEQVEKQEKLIGIMGYPGDQPIPPPRAVSRYADPTGGYTCVMHLGIRTKLPGKCPKCGMDLVSVEPRIPEEFNLKFDSVPKIIVPNKLVKLHLTVSNPRDGVVVKQFALMHDKLFHLFLVSQDLSDFQHIHPQQLEDGSFEIDTLLLRSGLYKVYADFYPLEGAPQMLQTHLATMGWQGDVFGGQARLKPDLKLSKVAVGIPVTKDFFADLKTLFEFPVVSREVTSTGAGALEIPGLQGGERRGGVTDAEIHLTGTIDGVRLVDPLRIRPAFAE